MAHIDSVRAAISATGASVTASEDEYGNVRIYCRERGRLRVAEEGVPGYLSPAEIETQIRRLAGLFDRMDSAPDLIGD